MLKTAKSKAEALFTAPQTKDDMALNEGEKARREKAAHVAGLRALRLAKEAADKKAAAEKTAAKNK